jgi:glycerol-3-phosphate acyltransferase PlsX
MATARYVLKTLPGIDRPAICASIPSLDGSVRMLDLGANVDCSAEHLFQFAVMGSVLTEAVDNLPNPRVGLLNNGEEEIKGNDQVKRAAQLLQQTALTYQGYVEGDRVYHGVVDVPACDAFVAIVATNTSEGVAWLISHYMQAEFRRNALTKIAGLAALPVLNALRRRLDTRAYNGASLLGLRGIVLKSHGSADVYAFEKAIEVGIAEAETAVPTLIDQRLGEAFARGRQES